MFTIYRWKKYKGEINESMLQMTSDARQMRECTLHKALQWIVPQFLNLRPKMAKSIVYVITLITNRNHAFHCLN